MPAKNLAQLALGTRLAALSSFDTKARTAEMIFSRGSRVKRIDWNSYTEYWEELSMKSEHVNLDRVRAGAVPFLKDHGGFMGASVDDVLGRVTDASVDGTQGVAKVRFSEREELQPIIRDIEAGVLPNVSVGYRVHKLEKVGEEDGLPILRATDWEVFEVSSVAMPADPGAQFRSADGKIDGKKPPLFACEVRGMEWPEKRSEENAIAKALASPQDQNSKDKTRGDGEMTPEELKAQAEKQAAVEAEAKRQLEAKIAEGRAEGVKQERERAAGIRHAVRAAGFEDSMADELIGKADVTLDGARTVIIEKLSEKNKAQPTRSVRIESGNLDETKTRRESIGEMILHRGDSASHKMTERSRRFAGMTLFEMARESLRLQGVDMDGMSRQRLAERAMHSTSDFPEITANVANKSLRDAFLAAPQTFDGFTRRVQNPDFKEISRTQLGLGSSLAEVGENGEVTYGTMGEAAEKYRIKRFAKALSIGSDALINDDLNAFVRIPAQMGAKARSLESDVVYAILTANAAMADGVALFHATHGNLSAAAAIAIASLADARGKMRLQKEMDGEPLNLAVKQLIVPVELETVAEQYITQVQANLQSSNNPFAAGGRSALSLVVEPRLSAASASIWYAAADKAMIDMIELATLSGSTEPEVTTGADFDVLGVKMKVVHCVGAKAIDWRGLFRNG